MPYFDESLTSFNPELGGLLFAVFPYLRLLGGERFADGLLLLLRASPPFEFVFDSLLSGYLHLLLQDSLLLRLFLSQSLLVDDSHYL